MKTCCDCKQEFPVEAFYRYRNGWIHSYCKRCHSARCQRWRKANPAKAKGSASKQPEATKAYRLEWRRKQRAKVISALGQCCVRCGFSDVRALQIDHVNGGGNAERYSLGSPNKLYRKILINGADGYQLLCANCNWIKRHENQEYRMNYRKAKV